MKDRMNALALAGALLCVLAAAPGAANAADGKSDTLRPSGAVYAVDDSLGFELTAVESAASDASLLISNRTKQPLLIQDLNYEVIVIIKPGVTLDVGAANKRLPDAVMITRPGETGAHYATLKNGLTLTAIDREGGAS